MTNAKVRGKFVTVKVTADDIKNGIRRAATRCPLALAIQRACNWEQSPSVGCLGVLPEPEDRTHDFDPIYQTILLPPKADAFWDKFDKDIPVKPFSFRIKVPISLLKK